MVQAPDGDWTHNLLITGEKVVGSITVWGSAIIFPRLGLDKSLLIIQDIPKLPHLQSISQY